MSSDSGKLNKKWNTIKEQLICLCALNKLPKGNEDLAKFLNEDISLKNLNSQIFNSICYFVLGFINFEERDKLIRWPLINIQTNTKFRKGVSSMVTNLQEKFPWANIKKLPESYFMNPHAYQSRVVDFISKLTNLATHLTLNDPELLMMQSGENLSSKEINIMIEVISKARQHEEKLIGENTQPINELEEVKNEICDKCIALKQTIDELKHYLNSLIKHGVSEGIFPAASKVDTNDLKKIKDEKLSELNSINEELSTYSIPGKELLSKIKALKNPMSLSAKDFGCTKSSPDIIQAASRVCGDLYQLFQFITSKSSNKEDEDNFYELSKIAKKSLMEEKEALQSFLLKTSPMCQKDAF